MQTEPLLNIQGRNAKAAVEELAVVQPVIGEPSVPVAAIVTLRALPLRPKPVPQAERRPEERDGVRRVNSFVAAAMPSVGTSPRRRSRQLDSVEPSPASLTAHKTVSRKHTTKRP